MARRCLTASCRRSIFTERFGDDVLAPRPLGASFVDPTLLPLRSVFNTRAICNARRSTPPFSLGPRVARTIKEIVRETGQSRWLVLKNPARPAFGYYPHTGEFTGPASSVARRAMGYRRRNGVELWRRLRASGFRGSLRVVSEWACRRRRAEKMDEAGLHRTPLARTIARLMTTGRDALSKTETVTIATIEDGVLALVDASAAVTAFQTMIRMKAGDELDGWIDRAKASLLASFANGVMKDRRHRGGDRLDTKRASCFSGSHASTEGRSKKPVSRSTVRKLLIRRRYLAIISADTLSHDPPLGPTGR